MALTKHVISSILAAVLVAEAWGVPLNTEHSATLEPRTDEDASDFQRAIAQGKLTYNTMQGHAIPIDHKPAPMTREQIQTDLESQGWKLMDDPASAHILQVAEARANAPIWDMLNSDCLTPVLIAMASTTQPKEFMPTVYWHNDTLINKHWSLPGEEVVFEFRNGTLPEGLDRDWERLAAMDYWGKYDGSKLGSFVECDVPEDEFFDSLKAQASISDFDFPGKTFKVGEDGFYGLLGLSSGRAAANLMNNGGEIKAGKKCIVEIQVWKPKQGVANVWYKFGEGECEGDAGQKRGLVRRVGGESSRQGQQQTGHPDRDPFSDAVKAGRALFQAVSRTDKAPQSDPDLDLRDDPYDFGWDDVSKDAPDQGGPHPIENQRKLVEECIIPAGKTIIGSFDPHTISIKKYTLQGQESNAGIGFEDWYDKRMIFSIEANDLEALEKQGKIHGKVPALNRWSQFVFLDYFGSPEVHPENKLDLIVRCGVTDAVSKNILETVKERTGGKEIWPPPVAKDTGEPSDKTPTPAPVRLGVKYTPQQDEFYALLGTPFGRDVADLFVQNSKDIGHFSITSATFWTNKAGTPNLLFHVRKVEAAAPPKKPAVLGGLFGAGRSGKGSRTGSRDLLPRVNGESSRQGGQGQGGQGQGASSADGAYFNAAVQEGLRIQQQVINGVYTTITRPPSAAEVQTSNWNDYSKIPESNGGPKPLDEQTDVIESCIMPPGKTISSGFDGRSLVVKKYVHSPSGAYFENWYESGMIFSIDNSSPSARQRQGHYKGPLPPLRYWNQFAYLDYYKFIGFSDLEAVVHCNVMEDKTRRLVRDIRARRHLEAGKAIKFGQLHFPQKSYEFAALLTTPAAKGTLELLALVPRKEGRFEITSITLWTNEHGTANLAFGIGRLSGGSSRQSGKRDELDVDDARNAHLSQVAKNVVSKGRDIYNHMLTPGPGAPSGVELHSIFDLPHYGWRQIKPPRPLESKYLKALKQTWSYLQLPLKSFNDENYREHTMRYMYRFQDDPAVLDNQYAPGAMWIRSVGRSEKTALQPADVTAYLYKQHVFPQKPLEHIIGLEFDDPIFGKVLSELVKDLGRLTFANNITATPERNSDIFFICMATGFGPFVGEMLFYNRWQLEHRCVLEVNVWAGKKDVLSVHYKLGDCPASLSTIQKDSRQGNQPQKDTSKGSLTGGNGASQGLYKGPKLKVERRQIASALDEVDAHESRSAPLRLSDKAAIANGRKLYRQMIEPGIGEPSTWTHLSLDDMKLHGWKQMKVIPPYTAIASGMREVAKYLRLPSFPTFGSSNNIFRQVKYMDGADTSDNVFGPGIIFTINNDFGKHSSLNFSDVLHLAYTNTQDSQPLEHIVSVNIEDLYFRNILHKLVIPEDIPFAKKRIATPQQNSEIFFACLGAAEGPQIAQMLLQYRQSFGHKCVVKVMLWTDEDEVPSIYYQLGDCPMPGLSRGGTPRTRKGPLPEGSSRGGSPARPHIDHAAEDRGSRTDTKRSVERDKIPWQMLSSNPEDRDRSAKRTSPQQAIETGKKMQKKLDAKVSVKAASFQFKDLALWGWSPTTNVTLNTNALPDKRIESVRSQVYDNEASKAGTISHITWTHDKDTRNRRATGAFYENFYDPRMIVVKGDKTPQEAGAEHDPVVDRFPAIKSWATVTWLQYAQLFHPPAHKNFSAVLQLDVSNKESLSLINYIFKDLPKKTSFPGTAIQYGTPEFYTLLGIPNGQMVVSLLAQHKEEAFGQKCVQQVNVWWNGDLPTLWYWIQDTPCDGVLAPWDSIANHLRIGVPKYHRPVPEEGADPDRHMGDP